MTETRPCTRCIERPSVFALYVIAGLLVGYAAYAPLRSYALQVVVKVGAPLLFALTAWTCHRIERLRRYWGLPYAFLSVSLGAFIAWLTGDLPLRLLGLTTESLAGMALAKLSEALPIVVAILVLARLAGDRWGSLYVQWGKLWIGVVIGILTFGGFAAAAYQQALQLGVSVEALVMGLPWILTFALTNAFMEELWFRGLFLGRLEPFLGPWLSLLATSIVFTLVHLVVSYLSGAELLQFLAMLFPLALVWGFMMQRTRSILASVLFHAGGDLMIIVGFMAEM